MTDRALLNGMMAVLILIVLVGGILIVVGMTGNTTEEKKETMPQYINVVMQPDYNVTTEIGSDCTPLKTLRELQKQKIERNKAAVNYELEKEEYINKRKNWVRYINGEIIEGYDPRYDKVFDSQDMNVLGQI